MSALARREREAVFSLDEATVASGRLTEFASAWQEVLATEPLRNTAQRLLQTHPLRSADSLQLAAAIIAAELEPATLEFVEPRRSPQRGGHPRGIPDREGMTSLTSQMGGSLEVTCAPCIRMITSSRNTCAAKLMKRWLTRVACLDAVEHRGARPLAKYGPAAHRDRSLGVVAMIQASRSAARARTRCHLAMAVLVFACAFPDARGAAI